MFHPLTPFPELLDYAFFVPLLLRVTLGLFTLAIGFSARHKILSADAEQPRELTHIEMAYRGLFLVSAFALLLGFYVQIAALIVAILFIVSVLDKRARLTVEIGRTELTLLIVIALSLLFLGAGPFAFDLPL